MENLQLIKELGQLLAKKDKVTRVRISLETKDGLSFCYDSGFDGEIKK